MQYADKSLSPIQVAAKLRRELGESEYRSPGGSLRWDAIVRRARELVDAYCDENSFPPVLRRLYYFLLAEQIFHTLADPSAYTTLSDCLTRAREEGRFPDLLEEGRGITESARWLNAVEGVEALINQYRQDRMAGQEKQIWLCAEKRGFTSLLKLWFGDLGLPIVALGGYSSYTLTKTVRDCVEADGRPAVLIYSGDFDPSGLHLYETWLKQGDCWDQAERVGLTVEQIDEFDLPEQPAKDSDQRLPWFIEKTARKCQIEIEALPEDVLRKAYQDAIDQHFDYKTYHNVLDEEKVEKEKLQLAIEMMK